MLLLAVVVVVAVNFINVILRYIINSGLAYCETLSICLFMFMVVIGANIAVKTDGEIKIEIIRFKSPRKDAIYTYHIYIVMTVGFGLALLDHIIVFIKHILLISGQQVEGGAKTV